MDFEPQPRPRRFERSDVAPPAPAEPEVPAHHDVRGPQAPDKDAPDELAHGQAGEGPGERGDEDGLDAAAPEAFEPLGEGLEHEDLSAAQDALGMGGEGQDDGEEPLSPGPFDEHPKDSLMAEVEAVEIPRSDRRRSRKETAEIQIPDDLHGVSRGF